MISIFHMSVCSDAPAIPKFDTLPDGDVSTRTIDLSLGVEGVWQHVTRKSILEMED
jgi:hypothetical protein